MFRLELSLLHIDLPKEVIKRIIALLRAYLWAGCAKVTGGKCKVNWEKVCRPGGLSILNLEKFSSTLRLRWLWLEWVDETKAWIVLGNPCNAKDKALFAAATVVSVGNGENAKFWTSPWLDGICPKDIAPKIFEISRKKNCNVQRALENNLWLGQIDFSSEFEMEHIHQLVTLGDLLSNIQLD